MNGPADKLVTVIVPAYNRAGLVGETLDSIRAQTYPSIEIVVVDDCSTDATRETVRRWQQVHSYGPLAVHTMPSNGGKSAAVNRGFACAQGEYVMVLDSDDVLFPDAVEREVSFLNRHPECGAVCGNAALLRNDVKTEEPYGVRFPVEKELNDLAAYHGDLLLCGNALISSTVLLRKETIRATGEFNPRQRIIHDWDYWIRVAHRFPIGYINRNVVYYRTASHGSLSALHERTFTETVDLILAARTQYSSWALIKALVRQTKYNAWLARNDGDRAAMIRIVLKGFTTLPRMMIV